MPSISVEWTKISYSGTGRGISGTAAERILKLRKSRPGRKAFVRTIASIRCR
jgi:hypothetical protein